jgi:hypothetical protein
VTRTDQHRTRSINLLAFASRATIPSIYEPWAKEKTQTAYGNRKCLDFLVLSVYGFNGNSLIFRKKTSAPSDWIRIFPLDGCASEPSFTNLPFRYCFT